MSVKALEIMVGTAVIDPHFRATLLNGHRGRIIADFDLSPEEQHLIMGIQAESLQEFAQALEHWLEGQAAAGATASIASCALR